MNVTLITHLHCKSRLGSCTRELLAAKSELRYSTYLKWSAVGTGRLAKILYTIHFQSTIGFLPQLIRPVICILSMHALAHCIAVCTLYNPNSWRPSLKL